MTVRHTWPYCRFSGTTKGDSHAAPAATTCHSPRAREAHTRNILVAAFAVIQGHGEFTEEDWWPLRSPDDLTWTLKGVGNVSRKCNRKQLKQLLNQSS